MRAPRLVLLLALVLTAPAGAQEAPPSSVSTIAATVQDPAGVLDDAALARVGALSQDAWTRAQVSIAVTLVRDTGPRSVAEFARENWQARSLSGRAVLLVVAVDAHTNHLEVGTAIAPRFPHAVRLRVLDRVFAPTARAEGVRRATVRAVEALHAQALRLDAREGLGDLWGWLARYGVFVLVAAVGADGALRTLRRRRDLVQARAANFHDRLTTYRALRARLSPPPSGRGAYRRSPGAEAFVSDELELSALAARATAARDAWGAWRARVRELEAVTATLEARLAPLEARANADLRAKALRDALPSALEALRAEVADAPSQLARAEASWPASRLVDAREALTRARSELDLLSREVPEGLRRAEGLTDIALAEACDALDSLQQRLAAASRDAAAAGLRCRELERAAADIAALEGELDHQDAEALASSHPAASATLLEEHQTLLARAQALRGGDPVPFARALRALHEARRALLAPSGPRSSAARRDGALPGWVDRLLQSSPHDHASRGGGSSSGGSEGSSSGW